MLNRAIHICLGEKRATFMEKSSIFLKNRFNIFSCPIFKNHSTVTMIFILILIKMMNWDTYMHISTKKSILEYSCPHSQDLTFKLHNNVGRSNFDFFQNLEGKIHFLEKNFN